MDVHIEPKPHHCPVSDFFWELDSKMMGRPDGSIWRCDDCGRYWVKDICWVPVRWSHFKARRLIREFESGVSNA